MKRGPSVQDRPLQFLQPLPWQNRLAALAVNLVGLAVSVSFFLFSGGYRFLLSLVWQGRTTGAVSFATESGLPGLLLRITRRCETFYFYKPAGFTLEGRSALPTPCLRGSSPVELAFNVDNPAQSVPVIAGGAQWFLLVLGIVAVLGSLYFTLEDQVLRRKNTEISRREEAALARRTEFLPHASRRLTRTLNRWC